MAKFSGYIYLGKDSKNKEIRRYASANTQIGLDRKLADLKKKYLLGEMTVKTTTMDVWCARWLKTKENKAPATYSDYKKMLDLHILPDIGWIKVNAVRQIDIQDLITKLESKPRTAQKVSVMLSMIMKLAVINELCSKNPVQGIERPSAVAAKKRAITNHERKALEKMDLDLEDRVFILLMLRCGLRKQEVAGLHKLDIRDGRINIRRIVDLSTNKITERTKSKAGVRGIPIPSDLLVPLTAYLPTIDGYLFTNQDGGTLTASGLARRWERIRHLWNVAAGGAGSINPKTKRYKEIIWGIGQDVSPHLLRHTYGSDLAKMGYNPKELQYLMGHSSAQISLDIYAHTTAEEITAERLNGGLSEVAKIPRKSKTAKG